MKPTKLNKTTPQQSGRNLGKKYKKLTGYELATPEAEARGTKFVNWYAAALIKFLRKRVRDLDDETASEAMLCVYNDIVYKDLRVKNYFSYYLRAYHTLRIKRAIEYSKHLVKHDSLETSLDCPLAEKLIVDEFNSELYEQLADDLCNEMAAHVRANYSAREASLFEIYTGLQPDVTYESMGALLGISASLISNTIGAIKKDLRLKYAEKRLYLLSLL